MRYFMHGVICTLYTRVYRMMGSQFFWETTLQDMHQPLPENHWRY